jgi:hypothetical protein
VAASEKSVALDAALYACQLDRLDQMRICLWGVVKSSTPGNDDLGEAIAIAAQSNCPEFAVELLDYIEHVLKIPNPSDFSRNELIASFTNKVSKAIFLGKGFFGRGVVYWPMYFFESICLDDFEVRIKRKWFGLFEDVLIFRWSDIEDICVSTYPGWRVRSRVKLRKCKISTNEKSVTIDISNDFPDIENPLGFLNEIKLHFPRIEFVQSRRC